VSPSDPRGWALYARTFSVSAHGGAGGWLSGAARLSRQFGKADNLSTDTFGIATFSTASLVFSWGSQVPGPDRNPSVFAAPVEVVPEHRA
jgi:hypothetical protein